MYPFKNLVFEGGGVKGVAYVGAMKVLEQKGILPQIYRAGGTSAGAINATLFAAGYNVDETQKTLMSLDFNDFKDDSWGVLRDLNRLREDFGWYKGDYFRDWMGDLLKAKGFNRDITFRALAAETGIELFLYATNLSTKFGEVFSPEHTPRKRVVEAVRRSMSIPLFFTAIRDDRKDVFVDGGILNNYPVKLFDRLKYLENEDLIRIPDYYESENVELASNSPGSSTYVYNKETLGFRLDPGREIAVFRDGQTPQSEHIENFLDYTMQLVKTLLSVQENQHLHSDDWHRTVYIDTKGYSTFDFDLSTDSKKELIESARKSTEDYFDWWSKKGKTEATNHPENSN